MNNSNRTIVFGLMAVLTCFAGMTPMLYAAQSSDSAASSNLPEGTMRIEHIVGPSESLADIAAAYGVPATSIQKWNGLQGLRAPVGSRLSVYVVKSAQGVSQLASANTNSLSHRVASGDTLTSVSHQYGVDMGDLVHWNRLADARLSEGQVLTVYVSDAVYGKYRDQKAPVVATAALAPATPKSEPEPTKAAPVKVASAPVVTNQNFAAAGISAAEDSSADAEREARRQRKADKKAAREAKELEQQRELEEARLARAADIIAQERERKEAKLAREAANEAKKAEKLAKREEAQRAREADLFAMQRERQEARAGRIAADEAAEAEEPAVPEPSDDTIVVAKNLEVFEFVPRKGPAVEVPRSILNPSPGVEEAITIRTEDLHGISSREIEIAVAQHTMDLAVAISTVNAVDAHVSAVGFSDYIVGASDVIEFMSFNDATLNRQVTVRYDGFVSLPLINDIQIGGFTRAEAEARVRDAYGEVYREPEISLTVVTPESKTYTVSGDIELPGRYAYTRRTTLNEALSLAGGLRTRQAGGSSNGGFVGITGQITKAFVIRFINGERQVIPFDMRGINKPGNHSGDVEVFYGDVIYVPEGVNLVYLLGESSAPRIVELTEGMTLLQMVSLAGGFNLSTARIKEVVLLRQVNNEYTDVRRINVREILNNGGDIRLSPGDVIFIPQKHMVRLSEFVQRFTGSISPILDMYNSGIDALYNLDLSSERLDALQNQNNVNIGVRGRTGSTIRPGTRR